MYRVYLYKHIIGRVCVCVYVFVLIVSSKCFYSTSDLRL